MNVFLQSHPAPAIMLAGLSASEVLQGLATIPFYIVVLLLPLGLLIFAAYFFISLPLRRQERARFFLDLLETALKKGGAVEAQLISMSESRDPAPGVRFHLLAAHLQSGLRFADALARVPRLLSPRIAAMLRAGEQLGDLRKVLPACRRLAQDAVSQTRSGAHYLLMLTFIVTPVILFTLSVIINLILPKFREIFTGMTTATWPLFDVLVAAREWIIAAEIGVMLLTLVGIFFYIGGPRAVGWVQFGVAPFADWIAWQVPWKRKRIQRDFAMMLAILLDSGVPEGDAVRLAATSTANEHFATRAGRVTGSLAEGIKLTDAISALDRAGEFHWRLTNAPHTHGGFLTALNGWCETLDAKAFQQEQAAAQLATTGLVLFNGVVVGFICIACFGALVEIVKEGVLW